MCCGMKFISFLMYSVLSSLLLNETNENCIMKIRIKSNLQFKVKISVSFRLNSLKVNVWSVMLKHFYIVQLIHQFTTFAITKFSIQSIKNDTHDFIPSNVLCKTIITFNPVSLAIFCFCGMSTLFCSHYLALFITFHDS